MIVLKVCLVKIWLLEILNNLQRYMNDESKISFDINALAYDNIIPKFIVPLKSYNFQNEKNTIVINIKKYKMCTRTDFDFDVKSFETAHILWNKYFKFSEMIENNIPSIDKETTLGVHYRGTDKNVDLSQANPISQEEFLIIINDFLSKNNNIKNIYCCSDETSFIENVKNKFKNINVIAYNQLRSPDTTKAFFRLGYEIEKNMQDNLTIGALVDMITLSKCKYVIKTSSALSSFSKIINPQLIVFSVSAMKERWFPTGLIQTYQSDSIEVNSILKRTMLGNV